MLEDASALIIYHMKRQTAIHKEDKAKIKSVVLQFLQDLFFAPHGDLSDDEQDQDEKMTEKPNEAVTANGEHLISCDDMYNLIFVNNTWFILFRLHQVSTVN